MFITDATVPQENLVGEPGGGWSVLQIALAYERRLMGDLARTTRPATKPQADTDSLVAMARNAGKLGDRHTRQEIARVEG